MAGEREMEVEVCSFLPFFIFSISFYFFLGVVLGMGTVNQSGTRAIRNRTIFFDGEMFSSLESSGSKSNNNHLLLSNSTIAMSTRMRFVMN